MFFCSYKCSNTFVAISKGSLQASQHTYQTKVHPGQLTLFVISLHKYINLFMKLGKICFSQMHGEILSRMQFYWMDTRDEIFCNSEYYALQRYIFQRSPIFLFAHSYDSIGIFSSSFIKSSKFLCTYVLFVNYRPQAQIFCKDVDTFRILRIQGQRKITFFRLCFSDSRLFMSFLSLKYENYLSLQRRRLLITQRVNGINTVKNDAVDQFSFQRGNYCVHVTRTYQRNKEESREWEQKQCINPNRK